MLVKTTELFIKDTNLGELLKIRCGIIRTLLKELYLCRQNKLLLTSFFLTFFLFLLNSDDVNVDLLWFFFNFSMFLKSDSPKKRKRRCKEVILFIKAWVFLVFSNWISWWNFKHGNVGDISPPTIWFAAILAYSRTREFYYAYYVLNTLISMATEGSVHCLALAYVVN